MDMTVMRGTTIPIVLTLQILGQPEPVSLTGDMAAVFRIKANPNSQGWMYQRVLTSANEQSPGVYSFNMLPSDTENWAYGEYYYDYGVQFSVNDYMPCTPTSKFIVVESIAGRINASDIHYADIENGSVTTIKIADQAVTIDKLHPNVNPESLGAADREHNHDDLYYGVIEIDEKIDNINKAIAAEGKKAADALDAFKADGAIGEDNLGTNAVVTPKIKDGNVTFEKLADNAVSQIFTAAIGTEWTGEAAPYTQEIDVTGILAADKPIIGVVYSDVYETAEAQKDAWNLIYRIKTEAGKIVVYASDKTKTEIPVQLMCVRK